MTAFETSLYWFIFGVLAVGIGFFSPRQSVRNIGVEALVLKWPTVLLCVALLLGAYLRFSNLDFGFPELYHPDEVRKARILRTMSESATWNPKYFLHPSLLLYLTKILSKLFFLIGIYPDDIILRNVIAGRSISAIAGLGSVGIAYLIGRVFFTNSIAALAAFLISVSPLAVDCSKYFKEDSLFCFFLLLAFWVTLLGLKERSFLYLAGLLSGITAGSKYTGVVTVFFPIAAVFLPDLLEKNFSLSFQKIKTSILIFLLFLVGFVLTTPYALITPSALIDGFNSERHHALNGHGGISISAWSRLFTYHLSRSLAPGLTLPVLFAGLMGIGRLVKSRASSTLLLLAAVIGFYLAAELVKSKPMPQPERYALPAALFFIFSACYIVNQLSSRTLQLAAAGILILAPTYAGVWSSVVIRPDTREVMTEWFKQNIPKNKRVILVGLPNYAPRLARAGYSIKAISPEGSSGHSTAESLQKSKFDYLLVTSLSYDRFFKEPEADQSLKDKFVSYDQRLEITHVEQSPYGSQGFHNPVLKLYRLR